ncbi:MAG: hypothetical protein ACOCYP_07260 [Planctomycetota bacterium]
MDVGDGTLFRFDKDAAEMRSLYLKAFFQIPIGLLLLFGLIALIAWAITGDRPSFGTILFSAFGVGALAYPLLVFRLWRMRGAVGAWRITVDDEGMRHRVPGGYGSEADDWSLRWEEVRSIRYRGQDRLLRNDNPGKPFLWLVDADGATHKVDPVSCVNIDQLYQAVKRARKRASRARAQR